MSQRTFIERTAKRPLNLAITVNQNEEIVSRLLDSGEDGEEETDNFADFYGFLAKKAVELAKAYQPKLLDGIKVAVEMVNSIAKDEQDGDVDMKVEIAPNATTELKPIPYNNNDEINLPVDEGDLIKAKYHKGKFLADITKTDDIKQEEEHTYRHKKLTDQDEKNTYSDFMKKWKAGDIEKVNEERRYLINNRPTHKADFRDKVWAAANKEVDANGTFVRDANGEDIKIYEGEPWDAGHKHGKEYRVLVDDYIDGFITWDEFLEEYHDVDNYQVEDVHENRSHKHEKK